MTIIPESAPEESPTPVQLSDEDVIARASRRPGFAVLYRGDTSKIQGGERAAVRKVLKDLAYWTGKDAEQMLRLFTVSKLAELPMWQEADADTRCQMVEDASARQEKVYTPRKKAAEQIADDANDALRLSPTIAVVERRVCRMTQAGDWIRSSNFTAWIQTVTTIVGPDGQKRTRYTMGGELDTAQPLPAIEVDPDEFESLRWLYTNGAAWLRAVIEPGNTSRGSVRAAIQLLSEHRGVHEATIFAFTGWVHIDGAWFFLHHGGGLGAHGNRTDVVCELPSVFRHYLLPDSPSRSELKRYFNSWTRLFTLAPRHIMATLLASVPRAILGEFRLQDAAIFSIGPTGSYKSELQALVLGHFGSGFNRLAIPLNLASTANFLEIMLNMAKDVVAVVDDHVEEGGRGNADHAQEVVARILRSVGNAGGRGRANPDGTVREAPFPRGVVEISGEDTPRTHSAVARATVAQHRRHDVDLGVLTDMQEARDAGVFAAITAAFVQFVAAHWDATRERFLAEIKHYQARYRGAAMGHPRATEAIASLTAAASVWLDAFVEMDVCTEPERERLLKLFETGLLEAGTAQADALRESDPIDTFVDLLRSAVSSGRAHLADRETNGEPMMAMRYGWRPRVVRPRGALEEVAGCEAKGDRIGWIDRDTGSVFLDPSAAYAAVSDVGSRINRRIHLTERALGVRLQERGLLKSADPGRYTTRVMVAGSRHRVHHLPLLTLFPETDQTDGQLVQMHEGVA